MLNSQVELSKRSWEVNHNVYSPCILKIEH
jgi:hypothetical protein